MDRGGVDADGTFGWHISARSIVLRAARWVVEKSLRRRSDENAQHEFFTIRIDDFVNVLAITRDGMFVFVRQFRHGCECPMVELPGGLHDNAAESPAEAARRELIEETGYDSPELVPLGVIHSNPAMLNNQAHCFLARDAARVCAPRLEATEDIELLLVPCDEIDEWVREGTLSSAQVLAALHLYNTQITKKT